MTIQIHRRNEIAWQFLVYKIRNSNLKNTDINRPQTRQKIRLTAEQIDVSFKEALEFARIILEEANKKY